jgi:hypothetical protein
MESADDGLEKEERDVEILPSRTDVHGRRMGICE